MNNRVRFIAGCAGFALILSAVSGLVGGVPAGLLLLRAVFSGLLFGLFAVAVQAVVQRFLPELDVLFRGNGLDAASHEPQPRVDIVVDDEDQLADADTPFPVEEDGLDRAGSEEPDSAETFAEESVDSAGPDALDESADLVEAAEPKDELATEAEEVGAQERREVTAPGYDPADAVEPDSVDQLPDVGSFSDGFSDTDAPDYGSDDSSRSDGQDPAMMARALQTMLKRDT